jgi:hypothetical protein
MLRPEELFPKCENSPHVSIYGASPASWLLFDLSKVQQLKESLDNNVYWLGILNFKINNHYFQVNLSVLIDILLAPRIEDNVNKQCSSSWNFDYSRFHNHREPYCIYVNII